MKLLCRLFVTDLFQQAGTRKPGGELWNWTPSGQVLSWKATGWDVENIRLLQKQVDVIWWVPVITVHKVLWVTLNPACLRKWPSLVVISWNRSCCQFTWCTRRWEEKMEMEMCQQQERVCHSLHFLTKALFLWTETKCSVIQWEILYSSLVNNNIHLLADLQSPQTAWREDQKKQGLNGRKCLQCGIAWKLIYMYICICVYMCVCYCYYFHIDIFIFN